MRLVPCLPKSNGAELSGVTRAQIGTPEEKRTRIRFRSPRNELFGEEMLFRASSPLSGTDRITATRRGSGRGPSPN